MTIRIYPRNENKWDLQQRIEEEYNNCYFDDLSKTFRQRLIESDVYLTNCTHTTYLEALASKVKVLIPLLLNYLLIFIDLNLK